MDPACWASALASVPAIVAAVTSLIVAWKAHGAATAAAAVVTRLHGPEESRK